MKEIKTKIDYDTIITNIFYNLVKTTLVEFGKVKTSYKLELLIDLTNKKIKIPDKCKQSYSNDEMVIEINALKSKIEFKKDYFTTYITSNDNDETYKIEVPYSAVMCIVDDETGYTIDYSMIDDMRDIIKEIDDYENDEYDMTALDDDNKFINAIINITSKCLGNSLVEKSKKQNNKKGLKKIKQNSEKEGKVIYFKNILTTDKE